ncbi:Ref family recombination enhancement nuclease [Serratia liquefaciens]|uniref:Ref family recombination enhancement nuclease n=2 Tax=Serratia TaxID=613 RepID=UPI0039AFD69A
MQTLKNYGRTPTAEERRFMDKMGKLPCIACLLHGQKSYEISLHHIDGRVKPGAHKRILPLCVWHHQHAAPLESRRRFPWLIPVHACGTVGGKADFERRNNTQDFLLELAISLADKIESDQLVI